MSKKKKEFKDIPMGEDVVHMEFTRARWKHFMRWLVFGFVFFLFVMLAMTSYRSHFMLHKPFMLQEMVVYIITFLMILPLVSSLVLEVDHVTLNEDGLILQNLLLRKTEKWENVVKFHDPAYLKFAILKTKGFLYLLNRRDIGNFDKLLETIREKTVNLPK